MAVVERWVYGYRMSGDSPRSRLCLFVRVGCGWLWFVLGPEKGCCSRWVEVER
jgi:hypothetical protein